MEYTVLEERIKFLKLEVKYLEEILLSTSYKKLSTIWNPEIHAYTSDK